MKTTYFKVLGRQGNQVGVRKKINDARKLRKWWKSGVLKDDVCIIIKVTEEVVK